MVVNLSFVVYFALNLVNGLKNSDTLVSQKFSNWGALDSGLSQCKFNSTNKLLNGDFSLPAISPSTFLYGYPLFWTGSGILGPGSAGAWGLNPPAPYVQASFLQGFGANTYQSISIPPGAYSLSFLIASRPYFRRNRLFIYKDSTVLWKGFTNTSWTMFNLTAFTITASQTTIKFINEIPSEPSFDQTNFVAGVSLVQVEKGLGSCPANTYKCLSGCCSCPAYSYSNSSSLSCTCPAGYYETGYGSTLACIPCQANSNSVAGSVTCTCNAGFEEVDTGPNLRCLTCPPGSDAIHAGLANCSCSGGKMFYGTQSCSVFTSLVNGDFEQAPVPAPYTYTMGEPLGWYGVGGINGNGGLTTQYSVYQATSNDTTFGGGSAPSGNQYLVVEQASTYLQQTVWLPAGTYTLYYYARARPNYSYLIAFTVSINSVLMSSSILTATWQLFSIPNIAVTAGTSTTIRFANAATTEVGGSNYPIYDYFNELDDVTLVDVTRRRLQTSCPANYFSCTTSDTGCCACPAYSTSSAGSATCTCGSTYLSSGYGSTLTCTACPANSYVSNGACVCTGAYYRSNPGTPFTCVACPANSVQVYATSCECVSGYYQPSAWPFTSCTACNPGTTSYPMSLSCFQCSAGTYTSVPGSASCIPCGSGTYAANTGSSACTAAPPGYISCSASGSSTYGPCPANTYSLGDTTVCTACPTGQYSYAASSACIIDPSTFPTIEPSSVPSVTPTQYPLTPSYSPTAHPTTIPSSIPSVLPSAAPTLLPSVKPTAVPSLIPSLSPSALPTSLPSVTPSTIPTAQPSAQPSIHPTAIPSVVPSLVPTCDPARVPTQPPSTLPTASPSYSPTSFPTSVPSDTPTNTPTRSPTIIPTTSPTLSPTFVPSAAPSIQPTSEPSFEPSFVPSSSPSLLPSILPLVVPSNSPTSGAVIATNSDTATATASMPMIIGIVIAVALCCLICLYVAHRKHRYAKSVDEISKWMADPKRGDIEVTKNQGRYDRDNIPKKSLGERISDILRISTIYGSPSLVEANSGDMFDEQPAHTYRSYIDKDISKNVEHALYQSTGNNPMSQSHGENPMFRSVKFNPKDKNSIFQSVEQKSEPVYGI